MEKVTVKAELRTEKGTRDSRALRLKGGLPGVVYGHGEPPEHVVLEHHEIEVALAHGVRTFDVGIEGKSQYCLIKDVQYDHLGQDPIHIDLTRVDISERVKVSVGIELRGVPKGVSEGGILDLHMADIDVECLVTEIPGTLHPAVSQLGLGDTLRVKDLELPDGVVTLADSEERVASVRALAVSEEPAEPEEGAETPEEPERIGRVRKDDETEKGSS